VLLIDELEQPVEAAVWDQKSPPATWSAPHDRGTPADRQREFARRADQVSEIDAGHHPFLSEPAAVHDDAAFASPAATNNAGPVE
jgi:hypothetical protein